ncbi:DUF397 domain-containing protein [Saccharothrix coeruleofusca]|uniref:DUF397 domain-containing protein n=1 Tax=Saccharothrix coeruleofusca TaxID=33919 RepID=A0A918ANN5_9PSEU|nr:DUF397 domain-containing protein [Saccharothrix coeruleofusca]GGP54445.1 hypothetical protein GCM10010185_28690 [Saccharothrix coeruleofusca]
MNAIQQWRKASRSNAATNCVEIRRDMSAVRDSKNPDGPALRFTDAKALTTFVSALRSH